MCPLKLKQRERDFASFLSRLKFKQRERERETLNPFLRAPKKPWSAFRFSRFSLFARAQANAHVHFERERERELKTKIEKRKKDKFSQTSERLRERTLPRCRDLSLDKVVRRRLKSILKSIDPSIQSKTVSYRNASLGLLLLPSPSSPLAPASPVADSDGHLPAETKKINSLKNEGDTFSSPLPPPR